MAPGVPETLNSLNLGYPELSPEGGETWHHRGHDTAQGEEGAQGE